MVIGLTGEDGFTGGGGDTILKFKTHYNIIESEAFTENITYPEAMSDWTQDTLVEYPYVEPIFNRIEQPGTSNHVLQIGEVYGGFDKALTSPWLELDPVNPEFNMTFDHSYKLGDIGQVAQVQYSFDDENWLNMDTSLNVPAEYFGDTINYPAFVLESVSIPDFEGNTDFKIRFRINAFFSYTPISADWIIDNLALSGITNQPFLAVGIQTSNDLVFKDGFE